MNVKLPELGEAKSTGVVLNVLVSEGDRVEAQQPLIELETDKATTEVPAPEAGIVEKILVSKGDEVSAGDDVIVLARDSGSGSGSGSGSDSDSDSGSDSDSDSGSDSDSDAGSDADADADADTDAAPLRAAERSPSRSREGAGGRAAAGRDDAQPTRPSERKSAPPPTSGGTNASPAVRKLARELGVDDLTAVAATGRGGRVTEEDIKSHVRHLLAELPARARDPERPALPDFTQWGEIEREPLGAVRKATAENVARAWSEIPHVTQSDRADVTELDAFRRRWTDEHDEKLTPTAVIVAVVARALRKFESFNAAIDIDENARILRRYVDVAVAVDTDRGLLVPVIRGAADKRLADIADELARLAERAREGTLGADEMEGAGFTITNLGGLGTTTFTPIVPWPQVAILGVGRARTEPVHVDELPPDVARPDGADFVPRRVLPFSLSYDHRAVDGADAARFLRWICRALEEPLTLLD